MVYKEPDWRDENFADRAGTLNLGTRKISRSNSSQSREDVRVNNVDRKSGMYVIGVQGSGKSRLLETLIDQDVRSKRAVIVIDPHGDLIDNCIATWRIFWLALEDFTEPNIFESGVWVNRADLHGVYLLDMEDINFPFGVNLFGVQPNASVIEQQQTLNRALDVFEKCFPDTSRMLLEKYIGNIAPVFFAHAEKGYTLTDIRKFLFNEAFRARLLQSPKINPFIKDFWLDEYAQMSNSTRNTETRSLSTRLNKFTRSPIASTIIGQSQTTIDFRRAIENREVIFIRLPLQTLGDDAKLIGTLLISQIHAAVFSFKDIPLADRPSFSLYIDEFQNFVTPDIEEIYSQGRKFGCRMCVAHQRRDQVPSYLQKATKSADTIIAFRLTDEDARDMSPIFWGLTQRPINIIYDQVNDRQFEQHKNHIIKEFYADTVRPMLEAAKGQKGNPRAKEALERLNDLLYYSQKEARIDEARKQAFIKAYAGFEYITVTEGKIDDEAVLAYAIEYARAKERLESLQEEAKIVEGKIGGEIQLSPETLLYKELDSRSYELAKKQEADLEANREPSLKQEESRLQAELERVRGVPISDFSPKEWKILETGHWAFVEVNQFEDVQVNVYEESIEGLRQLARRYKRNLIVPLLFPWKEFYRLHVKYVAKRRELRQKQYLIEEKLRELYGERLISSARGCYSSDYKSTPFAKHFASREHQEYMSRLGKEKEAYAALQEKLRLRLEEIEDAIRGASEESVSMIVKLESARKELEFTNWVNTILIPVLNALIAEPIATDNMTLETSEIARLLKDLDTRQTLVKTGSLICKMETLETWPLVPDDVVKRRKDKIIEQTREKYCKPRYEVEREITRRLGLSLTDEREDALEQPALEDTEQTTQQDEAQPKKWSAWDDELP